MTLHADGPDESSQDFNRLFSKRERESIQYWRLRNASTLFQVSIKLLAMSVPIPGLACQLRPPKRWVRDYAKCAWVHMGRERKGRRFRPITDRELAQILSDYTCAFCKRFTFQNRVWLGWGARPTRQRCCNECYRKVEGLKS